MMTPQYMQKRINSIARSMNKLIDEIRKEYPDANYMINGNSILIMIDEYKGNECYSEIGSIAQSIALNHLDYGDWN